MYFGLLKYCLHAATSALRQNKLACRTPWIASPSGAEEEEDSRTLYEPVWTTIVRNEYCTSGHVIWLCRNVMC